MPFRKVSRGEPISIDADAFNAMQDAAQAYLAGLGRTTGPSFKMPVGYNGIVLVRNDSGVGLARYSVQRITGVAFFDDTTFRNEQLFTVDDPDDSENQKFVILQEGIPAGKIGRAMLSGLSVVSIDMQDEDHEFAGPSDGDAAKLVSASTGPFHIMYVDSGTGTKLGAGLFPVAQGGAAEHRYFEITAAEGSSPPYLYSADEVEWSSSTHSFGEKTGGTTITGDLRSIQEQSGYPYAGKIPVGAVVDAWLEGTDWLCEVVYYRGVYPG